MEIKGRLHCKRATIASGNQRVAHPAVQLAHGPYLKLYSMPLCLLAASAPYSTLCTYYPLVSQGDCRGGKILKWIMCGGGVWQRIAPLAKGQGLLDETWKKRRRHLGIWTSEPTIAAIPCSCLVCRLPHVSSLSGPLSHVRRTTLSPTPKERQSQRQWAARFVVPANSPFNRPLLPLRVETSCL